MVVVVVASWGWWCSVSDGVWPIPVADRRVERRAWMKEELVVIVAIAVGRGSAVVVATLVDQLLD